MNIFAGSRYVSWLPSFSVEVSHVQTIRQNHIATNSQLDAMARQVKNFLYPSNNSTYYLLNPYHVGANTFSSHSNVDDHRRFESDPFGRVDN